MLSITYFYREPRKTGVSIEGIFKLIKDCLKNDVTIKEFFCDGNISRIANIKLANKNANEINHITGDVNFLALGLKGKKNILTIHDIGHLETLKKRNYIQYLVYKIFWFQFPLKSISIVTVVSVFTKDTLIKYFNFPPERIRLIYNPVKPVFQFTQKEKLNKKPVILMLGTGKHKNLLNLIEAVNGLDIHVDIIGWPDADEIKRLDDYKISYSIYNMLTDEEVYIRYVACDLLFMASFYEGFGMPIIEAQSVGRPVITSNIGAMKEVARDTALLIDPHQPMEIKDAILQLTTSMEIYNKFVRLGRQNVIPYQYEKIAMQYLDVYKELSN